MKVIASGLLTFVAASLSVAAGAQQASNQEYALDIERQSIVGALNALSKQTGLQIAFIQETPTESVLVGPLRGRYTADAAMRELLSPNGFSFVRTNERTLVVTGPKRTSLRPPVPSRPDSSLVEWLRAKQRRRKVAAQARVRADEQQPVLGTEEVIVTAQKRAERLRDVPISISVSEGDLLDKSTYLGVTEALNSVPGVSALSAPNAGGNTLLSVRGVTASAANFTGSSPVAYYLDFVPFAFVKSAFALDSSAYDLERIEVLRGPQGTLYGASAQNGVVRVLTHGADLSEFEFKARATASSTEHGGNNSRIDSALNVPIIEGVVAARLVLGYQDLSGWIDKPADKDANDAEIRNARLRIDAQPTDALSLTLSSWHSRSDHGSASTAANGRTNPSLVPDPIHGDFEVYGFRASYDFNGVSLSSTSGYLDYYNRSYGDYSLLGLPETVIETVLQSKSFSQEVLLQSTHAGAWKWSLGGMYRDAKDRLFQFRRQYAQPTDYRDKSESIAVFGELTRLLFDGRFELTGGLRYFEDEVANQEFSRGTIAVVSPDQLIRSEAEFHKFSPRAVLAWHANNHVTAYTSYSEGFRSGFPQNGNVIAAAPQFPPLEADNLKNYEIGAKSSFWDGRLNVEGAAFYIDWQDIQQNLGVNIGTVTNPVNVSALVNGESASGPGLELAVRFEPTDGLLLGLSAGWNDLTLDAAVISSGLVLFEQGDRLSLSPEYVAAASAEYSFVPEGSNQKVRVWTSANYTSELVSHAIFNGERRVTGGDAITMVQVGVSLDAMDHWSATVFVDNLANEDGAPLQQANLPAVFRTSVRPRTAGVQLEYRF